MPDHDEDEPTQDAEQGYEIPIPDKSERDRLLGRVAKGTGTNGADHKKGNFPHG